MLKTFTIFCIFCKILQCYCDESLLELYGKYKNENNIMDLNGLTNLMTGMDLLQSTSKSTSNNLSYTQQNLLNKYSISNTSINATQLNQILPSIIYMHLENVCRSNIQSQILMNSKVETYGYGTIAISIVTILSILGIILFPCFQKSFYEKILTILTSLSVGTLMSDASLHLLPTILGVANEDSTSQKASTQIEIPLYICRICILLVSIYALWLLDVFFSRFTGGHSHGLSLDTDDVNTNKITPINEFSTHVHNHTLTPVNVIVELPVFKESENKETKKEILTRYFCFEVKQIRPTAWMILLAEADSIHNFVDGLSIGASFAVSNRIGISTTIAIVLHEIPHELGTYAILVKCGFTHFQALFYNFISAIFCFIGFYVGASISSTDNLCTWVFSITIGMFYYIALTDLLPELLLHTKTNWSWSYFAFINIFMWLGFLIMFLLVLFEDKINV